MFLISGLLFAIAWIVAAFVSGLFVKFFLVNFSLVYPTKSNSEAFKNGCTICQGTKCKRSPHKASFIFDHTRLELQESLSNALENFCDTVLRKFVDSWHNEVAISDDFALHLRYCIRHFVVHIAYRLSKLDLPSILSEKAFGILCNHFDHFLSVRSRVVSENEAVAAEYNFHQVLLQRHASHLHLALHNRHSELLYLRSVARKLLPLCFHHSTQSCSSTTLLLQEIFASNVFLPVMDILADPDTINHLIILALGDEELPVRNSFSTARVNLMQNHLTPWLQLMKEKHSSRLCSDVLERDQFLLYDFMKYMNSINSVEPLTAFLSMNAICNNFFKAPDSPATWESIQNELRSLRQLWNWDSDSACCYKSMAHFYPELDPLLTRFATSAPENIRTLFTEPVWLRCYEEVSAMLDTIYLPQYALSHTLQAHRFGEPIDAPEVVMSHRTPSKFAHPVIPTSEFQHGGRPPNLPSGVTASQQISASTTSSSSMDDSGTQGEMIDAADSLLERLGLLRITSTSLSCEPGDDDWVPIQEEVNPVTSVPNAPSRNAVPSPTSTSTCVPCDVSTLRVSIPALSQLFLTGNRVDEFAFVIRVYRSDSDDASIKVYRKFNEFYVLEQKLIEFHGQFSEQLPRKISVQRTPEILDKYRPHFERFLRYLISRPKLKHSQLLYSFLTSSGTNSFESSMLPDLRLGRLARYMPMKLSKERGQNIDPFLADMLHSTWGIFAPAAATRQTRTASPSAMSVVSFHSSVGVDCVRHRRSDSLPHLSICATGTGLTTSTSTNFGFNSALATSGEQQPRSDLEVMLHRPMFWNNAGMPTDKWRLPSTNSTKEAVAHQLEVSCISSTRRVSNVQDGVMFLLNELLLETSTTSSPPIWTAEQSFGWESPWLNSVLRRARTWFQWQPRKWLITILETWRPLLASPAMQFFAWWLSHLLDKQLWQRDRAAAAVLTLQEHLFPPPGRPPKVLTDSERRQRRIEACRVLFNAIPTQVKSLAASEEVRMNCNLVLECFQHPKWNKQLSYVLVDTLLQELFPEVDFLQSTD